MYVAATKAKGQSNYSIIALYCAATLRTKKTMKLLKGSKTERDREDLARTRTGVAGIP